MRKVSKIIGFDQIPDICQRRELRRSIAAGEALPVLNGSDEWRFHYSIKEVAERGEIWFIADEEGKLIDLKYEEQWVCPFWPHEDLAYLACKKMDILGDIDPMPLDYWIDEVLDQNCRSDDCLIALCPSNFNAKLTSVDEVIAALTAYYKDPEAFWEQHFSDDKVFLTAKNIKTGPKGYLP